MPEEEKFEDAPSGWVNLNKPGDYVKATLLDIKTPTEVDQYGKIRRVFTLKVWEGEFHPLKEDKTLGEKVTLKAGDVMRFTSKDAIDAQMTQTKLDQKIILRLAELKPTKKGNPAKIVKLQNGPMDAEAVAERADFKSN